MKELTIEEVEDILEEVGVFNHYANALSSISCLIAAIDSDFSEEQADVIIKVIKEELLQSF
jgi:hypothetical protein